MAALVVSAYYDLVKWAVLRPAFSQAHDLRPHGATGVFSPGGDSRCLLRAGQ